jgi:hypothetical protein
MRMKEDGETGRRGDAGTGRHGDTETEPSDRVSPRLPISVSLLLRLQLPKNIHNYPASAELSHMQVIDPFRRDDLN